MIPEATPRKILQREPVRTELHETPRSKAPEAIHLNRRSARWSSRRRRDAWLLLVVLLLGMGTILALSNAGTLSQKQGNGSPPAPPPTPTTSATSSAAARVIARAAQVHLYPFPQSHIGLMQPAVDAQGKVWVGEMYANRLARLDSQSGAVTTWVPPNGQYGIMSTAIDRNGYIWFVGQGQTILDVLTQRGRRFAPSHSAPHMGIRWGHRISSSMSRVSSGLRHSRLGALDGLIRQQARSRPGLSLLLLQRFLLFLSASL
jgi:hypothetical protein